MLVYMSDYTYIAYCLFVILGLVLYLISQRKEKQKTELRILFIFTKEFPTVHYT